MNALINVPLVYYYFKINIYMKFIIIILINVKNVLILAYRAIIHNALNLIANQVNMEFPILKIVIIALQLARNAMDQAIKIVLSVNNIII